MSIFNSIKRATKKTIKVLGLVGLLSLPIGCGGDRENSTNRNPNFTSTPITTAVENFVYSYDSDANDADGDTLTYSLTQAPTGMIIDSSTGIINWTPNDSQSGMSHDITVKVEDGKGGSDTQNYTINVTNTETISGYVSDALDGSSLESIDVQVGTFTDATDSGGYWEIQNVPDGDYNVTISDSTSTYETFKPGFFRVGKLEKLSQDAQIYKQEHRGFVNNVARFNGRIVKWFSKPKFRIYTKEVTTGTPVDSTKITDVKNIIKTELTQFASDTYDFTDADIIEVNVRDPPGEFPGAIKIEFDNSFTPGYNGNWINGNEVTGAFVSLNTSSGKNWQLQELTASLIGSGETNDANYSDSILYGNSTNTLYSDDDLMISKLIYGNLQRTAGNKDYETSDNHDRNPDTNQWNLGFSGAKSTASYSISLDSDESDSLDTQDSSNNYDTPEEEKTLDVF